LPYQILRLQWKESRRLVLPKTSCFINNVCRSICNFNYPFSDNYLQMFHNTNNIYIACFCSVILALLLNGVGTVVRTWILVLMQLQLLPLLVKLIELHAPSSWKNLESCSTVSFTLTVILITFFHKAFCEWFDSLHHFFLFDHRKPYDPVLCRSAIQPWVLFCRLEELLWFALGNCSEFKENWQSYYVLDYLLTLFMIHMRTYYSVWSFSSPVQVWTHSHSFFYRWTKLSVHCDILDLLVLTRSIRDF
jgi:hypothetical protein